MKYTYPSIAQFQQHVELKDYRPPTKKEYVRYVCKLAEHFQCDPATLSENQLREYFLFLRQHKHYKPSPMKAAKFSLRCFYQQYLKLSGWTVFQEVRIAEPQVLPIVLSRGEVQAVLAAVREPRFRASLRLMYHCGLRVTACNGRKTGWDHSVRAWLTALWLKTGFVADGGRSPHRLECLNPVASSTQNSKSKRQG